ncbi:MAG: hypothetical protein DWQ05_16440 [Calditrichaeota bacterium]|nr:MAG: hypothetical protein DWQ05_16440 [Calditrichota bacterium]
MEISSKYVGVSLKEYRTVVRWRDTMNYAAAVGDNNPRYFDDRRKDGIVAPPMVAVALTWPIVQNLWEFIEASDFPFDILQRQVHYSEYLHLHDAIKPGDELWINGEIIAIVPGKSGTHIVIRFIAINQDGKAIFTEFIGGMMRGVHCSDAGAGGETLPKIPVPGKLNTPVWEKKIKIDPLLPYIYDGCSNIVFPIHTSQKFAQKVGLPGILLQGTAALAFAAREILDRHAESNPQKLKALSCRFADMILPGTKIKIQLLSLEKNGENIDLYFQILGEKNQLVIKNGFARMQT